MTTTPEPAVSPAPDTDALRAYLRRTIGGDFERRLIAADLLDDDDALSVLRVFEDVVPAIEREITSRHQAFVLMLADAKAERDDRIAGLRADLDQARRERAEVQRQARVWKLMAAARAESRDAYAAELKLAIEGLEEYQRQLAGARTIPDGAADGPEVTG